MSVLCWFMHLSLYVSLVQYVTYKSNNNLMTKIAAIKKVLEANGGSATMEQIYKGTKKFKKDVDQSTEWKAGLRGVLYREIRNGKIFRKVQGATYGLM